MEMLTAKQISERSGIPKTTVDRVIKNNLTTIVYEEVTKSIKRYNIETLPERIKSRIFAKI